MLLRIARHDPDRRLLRDGRQRPGSRRPQAALRRHRAAPLGPRADRREARDLLRAGPPDVDPAELTPPAQRPSPAESATASSPALTGNGSAIGSAASRLRP